MTQDELIPVELCDLRRGDIVYDIHGERYVLYSDPILDWNLWTAKATWDDYACNVTSMMELFMKPRHIKRLE